MRRIGTILTIALSLGLAVASDARASRQAVIGGEGEVYTIKSGSYGQLFPGGKQLTGAARSNPVLALDVVKPDGSVERSLVPETGGPEPERLPYLQYEEASGAVFLVWETRVSLIHSVLMLSSYNGTWLDPIAVVGNPFAPKTSPQLAVTHDSFQVPGSDGNLVDRHRTVLHLIWAQEAGPGSSEVFYTPVVLEDGNPVGSSPVINLNDFDTSEPAASDISPDLQQALAIRNGRDQRTVVVAFAAPRSRRIVTLEIDTIPMEIVQLADGARSHIVDIGARYSLPSDLKLLADGARSHIVDIGVAFHPQVVRALAEDIHAYIETEGPGKGLKVIADGARSHIVDIGAKLSGRGLRSANAASVGSTSAIVEIVPTETFTPPEDDRQALPHLLSVQVISDRPAPEVGAGEIMMLVSESGQEALVAWIKVDRLFYRETSGTAGWREPLQLRLSPALDLPQALEMLQRRIQNR
jgi:hypothetical protein